MKANANKKKFTVKQVEESTREYIDELTLAINEDRKAVQSNLPGFPHA